MHHDYSLRSISIFVFDKASFLLAWSCSMNSDINFITFLMVYSGRLVLCVPLNISRCLQGPLNVLYSFYELILSISLSSSPLMNTIIVDSLIRFTSYAMSSFQMSQWPFSWISDLSLQNTQGKRQLMRQFGSNLGEFYLAICLHRLLKDLKEESATMMGALPYFNAVAAPILRPHSTTRRPAFCRKFTTVSTCSDSLTPKLIVSSSVLWPQPMKSKAAREKRKGRKRMTPVASSREEELPWRQRRIHSFLYSGSKMVRVMDLSRWAITRSFRS